MSTKCACMHSVSHTIEMLLGRVVVKSLLTTVIVHSSDGPEKTEML